MDPIESAVLMNSISCLLLTVATTLALKDRSLGQQLRALKFLASYAMLTLLANFYLLSVSGRFVAQLSLALSATTVVLLWVTVYKFWAKGE